MKSEDNSLLFVLGALAVGGFIWALSERSKKNELVNELNQSKLELKQTQKDYLRLLQAYLEKTKELPLEVKNQLLNLRNQYQGINDEVAIELSTIVDLIKSGKDEIAIQRLATTIENVLKEKYIKHGFAKDKRSCPSLNSLLEKALELKWITKHEFQFSLFLKDKRNTVSHNIAVTIPENEKYISFLSGIEILYSLKGMKRG